MATINISAKDGTQHLIFIDKICNISQNLNSNTTTISLVNKETIISSLSVTELLRIIKPS